MQWDGDIEPHIDNNYNFGTNSLRWKNGYFNNRLTIGGSFIQDAGSGGTGEFIMNGDILPSQTTTWNLGSTSARWNDIWCTSGSLCTSNFRLKKDIKDLDYGLNEILNLRPVSYNWIENYSDKSNHFGFIAQELKRVFPNNIVVGEEGDTLAVRYSEIIPVLTKAIQQQQYIITKLENEFEKLKMTILDLNRFRVNEQNEPLNKLPVLFQNTQNQYDETIYIDYFLPETTTQASILVSDITGGMVYSSLLSKTGMGRVALKDLNITSGDYYYTMYVNRKKIDSLKIIVPEN